MSAWIAVRGTEDGPLFRPVNKGGRVIAGGMSPRAIGKRVQVLGARAGLGKVSPHMLRRSFATSLLSAGNDLSVTADLMGHARTDTTRLYDRRGESAKRAPRKRPEPAAERLDCIRGLTAGYPWKDHELTAVWRFPCENGTVIGHGSRTPPTEEDHDADASRRTYHADTVVAHSPPRGPGQGAASAPNAA